MSDNETPEELLAEPLVESDRDTVPDRAARAVEHNRAAKHQGEG
jgi:hypothetical protein